MIVLTVDVVEVGYGEMLTTQIAAVVPDVVKAVQREIRRDRL